MAFKTLLSKDGPSLSKVIAGVMKWGAWGANLSEDEMAELIKSCVDNNITSFDHADIYGGYTTEKAFGDAFKKSGIKRDQIQLITKCGICYPSDARPEFTIKSYNTTKDYILNCVDKSLENLGTNYIDLLLIHRPSPLMDLHDISETFAALKASGKVGYFGVSNFTTNQFQMLHSHFPIVTNQIEASMLQLDPFNSGILDQCQKFHIKPMAWSPLGGGVLFNDSDNFELVNRRDRLNTVAKKYGWELDDMAYYFLNHHPSRILPVTGTSKIERIIKAKTAFETKITNEQWFEIWTASSGVRVP